jgi:hypothetical protein
MFKKHATNFRPVFWLLSNIQYSHSARKTTTEFVSFLFKRSNSIWASKYIFFCTVMLGYNPSFCILLKFPVL